MKKILLILPLVLTLSLLASCDDFEVADKSKDVVISKVEYDRLEADAALGRQVGRFQIHRDGFRTWRLDTATGRSCLILTTDTDWKTGAKDQTSCADEDFERAQASK